MKSKITVKYEGWFLFCPCWFSDVESDEMEPIPKYHLEWLLEASLFVQQAINFAVSLVNPDACGFIASVRKLKAPITIFR